MKDDQTTQKDENGQLANLNLAPIKVYVELSVNIKSFLFSNYKMIWMS